MKHKFSNEYILENFLTKNRYYYRRNYAFTGSKYLFKDERLRKLKRIFLKGKCITLKDIMAWKKVLLESKITWIVLYAMTKKEAILFMIKIIEIIKGLHYNHSNRLKSWEQYSSGADFDEVVNVGNKFINKKYKKNEFKEKLHWLNNDTYGAFSLNPVYPWIGYAAYSFICALECELQGGYKMYSPSGTSESYKRYTMSFISDSISYSFTAISEINPKTRQKSYLKKIESFISKK